LAEHAEARLSCGNLVPVDLADGVHGVDSAESGALSDHGPEVYQ
jgi:hypothetical protein